VDFVRKKKNVDFCFFLFLRQRRKLSALTRRRVHSVWSGMQEIATDCDRLVLLIWQAERNSFRSTRICVTCSVELHKRGRTCKFRSHLILVVSAIC
jgi:hypothetical protein